jgi:hypothetical protein
MVEFAGPNSRARILDELRALPGIERLTWHPVGGGHLAE